MGSRRVSLAAVLLLVVSLLGGVSGAGAAPDSRGNAAPIRLKAATFHPGLGEQPNIPPGLAIAGYAQGQSGYYLVQFAGPVEQAWKDQVAGAGAELIDYVPDFAFKVRMTPAEAARVERLDAVAWVGLFHPAYKLSPELARDGQRLYSIRVEQGADAGLTAAAVASSGAEILGREGQHLLVAADGGQLDAIAHVLDVAWVSNFILPEKHNEYGAGAIMGANTANTNGYDGSTQIVAVADTGLGDGTAEGAHPDIPASRVVAVNNWAGAGNNCYSVVDDGAIDVDSGHGTHVAGSVLSDGGTSGEGKGTAPAAGLVFQSVENWADMKGLCAFSYPDGYYLIGLPSDLRQIFQQAYDQGARVHSNSWGSDVNGDYTADSANTDDFIWSRPDMTITFSAGNSGDDANTDGVVDNDSIGSPATAKNVITVGASENERPSYPCDTSLTYESHDSYQKGGDGTGLTCSEMGGNNVLGTGSRWGFTAEPLKSDPTAGNQEQMALFSSRGPTDDGRIKPDIVAPGTWILSGYSDLYQEHYDGNSTNPQNGLHQWDGWGMPASSPYKWMGGTSMSNPLAAGGAAVVRDYYKEAHSHNASAALTKATLINSAVDMLDENNDGADDNDFPIPNVHEGWGRVNVANATDGGHVFVDDATGLGTSGGATYAYDVAGGAPFKVTLVWSDYASTESASKNLVNDLDLVVTAPDGTTYNGNVFSSGWSQAGGNADRTNNVENVYVQSAASGTWTVEVRGYNVPNGPQPFALVVDGAGSSGGGGTDNPPSVTMTSPTDGATVSGTVNVAADAMDDNGVAQVEFFVDGASIGVDSAGSDGWSVSWDSTTVGDGSHTVSATATDTAGQTASASVGVTVDNVDSPPGVTITSPSDGATVSGTVNVAADATDDQGVTQVEFFMDATSIGIDSDGTNGWSVAWDTTTVSDGGHTLTATATDSAGQMASDNHSVTVDNSPDTSTIVHVGDLDGSTRLYVNGWTATVTITVHDASEATVSGATVSGTWSYSTSTVTCTTDDTGTCSITSGRIGKKTNSVSFAASDITGTGLTYDSTANHDPDGDSNGTSITVFKP